MIKFVCTQCGKGISAADEHAGKKARCPQCQHIMQIPQGGSPAKPAPVPASQPPVRSAPPQPAPEAVAPRPVPAPKKPPVEEEDIPEVEEAGEMEIAEEVSEEEFAAGQRRQRRRVADEDEDHPRRRSRNEDEDIEEAEEEAEDEDRPRRRQRRRRRARHGQWADCPQCGNHGDATRIWWTMWGGVIGPAIICHVRCNECGTHYNGKSGDSNTTAITLFVVISIAIGLALGVLGAIAESHK
jgi:hypothetical protein